MVGRDVMLRAALIAIALISLTADAADRSRKVRAEFMRTNPCPANGHTRGACPGWEADHDLSLCAGGADTADNLRWLTIEEHKAKTRADVRFCRAYSATRK